MSGELCVLWLLLYLQSFLRQKRSVVGRELGINVFVFVFVFCFFFFFIKEIVKLECCDPFGSNNLV